MKRRVAVLIGGSFLFWLAISSLVCLLGKYPRWNDPIFLPIFSNNTIVFQRGVLYCTVAVVLCLIPTAGTLIWANQNTKQSPSRQLIFVFGGIGARMGFVLLAGILFYVLIEEFQRTSFWIWILVFYLFTLALEIFLQLSSWYGKGWQTFRQEKS